MLVTDLDIPEFDYFDPTLSGERFHKVLKELHARHWVARWAFGWLILDREGLVGREVSASFVPKQGAAFLALRERLVYSYFGIAEIRSLRSVLYDLHAIVRLHMATELNAAEVMGPSLHPYGFATRG